MTPPSFGRPAALLTAFYGIKPWEIPDLTEEQIEMLMHELGFVRLLRDLPQLKYSFSKMSVEDCQKLIDDDERARAAAAAGQPAPMTRDQRTRARAWSILLQEYGVVDEERAPEAFEPLPISAAAARGILADLEDDLIGDAAWSRLLAGGTYRRVLATAGDA